MNNMRAILLGSMTVVLTIIRNDSLVLFQQYIHDKQTRSIS